jgi:hypothetical protein
MEAATSCSDIGDAAFMEWNLRLVFNLTLMCWRKSCSYSEICRFAFVSVTKAIAIALLSSQSLRNPKVFSILDIHKAQINLALLDASIFSNINLRDFTSRSDSKYL